MKPDHCLLLTTYYFTTCYLLLTTYYLPLVWIEYEAGLRLKRKHAACRIAYQVQSGAATCFYQCGLNDSLLTLKARPEARLLTTYYLLLTTYYFTTYYLLLPTYSEGETRGETRGK